MRSAERSTGPTTTGGAGLTSSRILVVDDDRAIRDMLQQALELEGHTVETAGDGAQALTAIERAPPALVLLDMRMPVLDGWGSCGSCGRARSRSRSWS